MKTVEMGVLIKFPTNKGNIDRPLLMDFPGGVAQDWRLKIHLHCSPPSVLEMLFKMLLLFFPPANFLQKDHRGLFLKAFSLPLGLKPESSPRITSISLTVQCVGTGERAEDMKMGEEAQAVPSGSCGEGQGFPLPLPQWQQLSEGGWLFISTWGCWCWITPSPDLVFPWEREGSRPVSVPTCLLPFPVFWSQILSLSGDV